MGKSEEREGKFIAFADDYKIAVIETKYGEIVRCPIEDMRFIGDAHRRDELPTPPPSEPPEYK